MEMQEHVNTAQWTPPTTIVGDQAVRVLNLSGDEGSFTIGLPMDMDSQYWTFSYNGDEYLVEVASCTHERAALFAPLTSYFLDGMSDDVWMESMYIVLQTVVSVRGMTPRLRWSFRAQRIILELTAQ